MSFHRYAPRVKPQAPARVDWSNPLTDGLVFLVPFTSQGMFHDIVGPEFLTIGSDASAIVDAHGMGVDLLGSTVANNYLGSSRPDLSFSGTDPISIYSISSQDAPSASQMAVLGAHNTYNGFSGYENEFNVTTSLAGLTPSQSNASILLVGGDVYHIMGTYGPSANLTTYVGAEATGEVISNAAATTGTYSAINGFVLGRLNTDAIPFNGKIYFIAAWRRELPEEEFTSLFDNPYQLLLNRRIVGRAPAGTTHENSISLSTATALSIADTLSLENSISFALNAGITPTNIATILGASSFSVLADISAENIATLEAAATLASTVGLAVANVMTLEEAVALATAADISSQGNLTLEEAVTLPADVDLSVTSGLTLSGTITLDSLLDLTSQSSQGYNNSITLDVATSLATSTTLTVSGTITLATSLDEALATDVTFEAALTLPVGIDLASDPAGSTYNASLTMNAAVGADVLAALTAGGAISLTVNGGLTTATTDDATVVGGVSLSGTFVVSTVWSGEFLVSTTWDGSV